MALGESRDQLDRDRLECPDADVLAEYADQTLSQADRARLERHLVDCADCRAVLAETAAFLRNESDRGATDGRARVLRFRSRWAVLGGSLAAAAALMLVARLDPSLMTRLGLGPSSDAAFTELVAAVGAERYVDGRLTGGFPYAPLRAETRGSGSTPDNVALLAAAARLEERAKANPNADTLHAWGVAQLQLRNLREAINSLEAARRQDPASTDLAVDLAVAYLDAATQLPDPALRPRALQILDDVLMRESTRPDALFNRAVALEGLARRAEAAEAWRAFLRVEPNGPWAAEASARITRIESGIPADVSVYALERSDQT